MHFGWHGWSAGSALTPEYDLGVEHRQQRLEVAVARGVEERFDHPALLVQALGPGLRRSADPPTRPARELAGGGYAPLHDRRDLLERHSEHVVQHEREPLGGCQRLEHHQKRQSDRIGEQRLMLGIARSLVDDDRLGEPAVGQLLAAGLTRAQHVQADPADDGGQPRAHVLHV